MSEWEVYTGTVSRRLLLRRRIALLFTGCLKGAAYTTMLQPPDTGPEELNESDVISLLSVFPSCCMTTPAGLPAGGGAPREAREMLPAVCMWHPAWRQCAETGPHAQLSVLPRHTQAVTEPRGHFRRVKSNFISLKETLLLVFILPPGRKTLPKELSPLRRKEGKSWLPGKRRRAELGRQTDRHCSTCSLQETWD